MNSKDIVLIGILSATITAGKLALSFIPNIEVVTLLFIAYTIVFGYRKTMFVSLIFTTTEIFIYGLNTWLLVYYFIWPFLILLTEIMKKAVKSEYGYAVLGGIFGYAFGFFFAIGESLFYGIAYGWAYWIRGLLFDLIHGTSNFIVILTLLNPLKSLLSKLKMAYYREKS
ncbi:MAG TPA: hypothetical protein GXX53_06600 [Tissierellia bacterium]|mgnify:CR=1 FL=1|nr:hypothetical protein [Tissierellia bacterium]